jgi:16S rRNA U516 pseudouridylate synthase RsuA-like enzyme
MVEAVGNEVEALRRIRLGSVGLGSLPEGEARRLTEGEVAALWKDARREDPER